MQRPELLESIAASLVGGSAHRQIARTLGCAPSTVTRIAARLGRHGIRLQALALRHRPAAEPFCLDHFETFELTQDLPFGVATLVGRRSWFVYALDPAPHGRSGRMTPAQRRRALRRLRTPRYGGYGGSMRRCLDLLMALHPDQPQSLMLATDDKPDYRWAVRRHPLRGRFFHQVFRNPPRRPKGEPRSEEAKRRDRALFACDVLHGLIRHSQAAHKRETLAFGRRLNALLERLFLLAVWRNFIKGRSERRPDRTTPAMWLGLTGEPWTWSRLLARRIFAHEADLPKVWQMLYDRGWTTPELGPNSRHRRRFAY